MVPNGVHFCIWLLLRLITAILVLGSNGWQPHPDVVYLRWGWFTVLYVKRNF
jgi:hypothetical protein